MARALPAIHFPAAGTRFFYIVVFESLRQQYKKELKQIPASGLLEKPL